VQVFCSSGSLYQRNGTRGARAEADTASEALAFVVEHFAVFHSSGLKLTSRRAFSAVNTCFRVCVRDKLARYNSLVHSESDEGAEGVAAT
jgi:hypothetical protein